MPTVQSVEGEVTVAGREFAATDIEVNVNSSLATNQALLSGFMDNPTDLQKNDQVEVKLRDDNQIEGNPSDGLVFIGELKRATQSVDNELDIEAYDMTSDMHGQTIQLQTEEPYPPAKIAADILDDLYPERNLFFGEINPNELEPGSIYVAAEGYVVEGPGTHMSWGSGKRGESFTSAIQELADMLVAAVWCDKRNVLRFEPYPEWRGFGGIEHVIETDAEGSNQEDIARVIVQSGAASVGSNPAESYVHAKTMPNATSEKPTDSNTKDKEVTLQDNNITSQEESEAKAISERLNIATTSNKGSITVPGTTNPNPWDVFFIPEGDNNIPIAGGDDYMIKSIQHVMNADSGWETKMNLTVDPYQELLEATPEELTASYREISDEQAQNFESRLVAENSEVFTFPDLFAAGAAEELISG